MRIRDPIHEAEEPFNLVPLTDMVFNLLIFFMAATTFAKVEREMSVSLPRAAASAGAVSAASRQLVVNIDAEGRPVVARKTYAVEALTGVVSAAVKANPDVVVVVRADERGTVKQFAAVLDACRRSGVKQANLSYVSGGK